MAVLVVLLLLLLDDDEEGGRRHFLGLLLTAGKHAVANDDGDDDDREETDDDDVVKSAGVGKSRISMTGRASPWSNLLLSIHTYITYISPRLQPIIIIIHLPTSDTQDTAATAIVAFDDWRLLGAGHSAPGPHTPGLPAAVGLCGCCNVSRMPVMMS